MPAANPSGLVWTRKSSPYSAAIRSRNAIISRNFQVVSIWSSGNGILEGKKALRARCKSTEESLPIEYIITGRSKLAATSRRISMLSLSKRDK